MQVSGLSNNSWLQQLQQDLLGASASSATGGQSLPVGGQGSTGSDDTSTTAIQASSPSPVFGGSLLSSFMLGALFGAQAPAPTQSPASGTSSPDGSSSAAAAVQPASTSATTPGASLLNANMLGNLFDVQQQQPAAPGTFMAGQIIKADDSNGDGELSLSEITSALTSANGVAPNASSLQSVFNQLDTNGDGELSQSELAAGLSQMMQQQSPQQAQGMHHHHHHHGGGPQTMQPDSTTASSSSTTTASAAATDETDSAEGTSATTPTPTPAAS